MADPSTTSSSVSPAGEREGRSAQHGDRQATLPSRQPDYDLGILLVHGIGSQASGETLVGWGDALLKTIRRATRQRVPLVAEWAGPADHGRSGGAAEAVLRIRGGGREERWLVSEAWWADAFVRPSYRELVAWSLKALPWSVAIHIARRYWQTAGVDTPRAKVVPAAIATAQLLVALALAPLFIALLALALVVGLLPIPQLREAALAAQRTLTATVGDSLAFVQSPIRAALIRTRILDSLRQLKSRCAATIVVAHSQGAAVALDALGGILDPSFTAETGGNRAQTGAPGVEAARATRPAGPDASPTPAETVAQRAVPDTLVTFGAGTNQLTSLKVLSAGLPAKVGVNPASFLIGALAATIGLTWWLYSGLNAGRTSLGAIALATSLQVVLVAVFGFVASMARRLIRRLGQRWSRVRQHTDRVAVWTIAVPVLTVVVTAVVWADRQDLPFMPVTFLFMALLLLAGSIAMILSKDLRTLVTTVRNPPGLSRWIDVYASADPVPNGPTETEQPGVPQSVQIWNRDSVLADHTAYWDNADGFVLRVVRECAELANSPWRAELPPDTCAPSLRAAWRTGFLRLARRAIAGSIAASVAVLGVEYWSAIPSPVILPDWLAGLLPASLPVGATSAWRLSVLAALVVLTAWVCTRPLSWVWRAWGRSEQAAVLAHREPGGGELNWLTGMGMVVWTVLAMEFAIARESLSWVGTLLADPVGGLVAPGGLAFLSALALLKLVPPPRVADTPPATTTPEPG